MSTVNGKNLREDYGVGYGRTREWAAVPEGLYTFAPVGGSTTVLCADCNGAYDGLVYDPATDTFHHRQPMDCLKRNV